jgi:hypothetical protein
LDTTLTWNSTTGPGFGDPPHYDVWLGTEADLSNAELVADSIADTTCNIADIEDDETYYWTVRATDRNSEGTWASDTLSFRTYLPESPIEFGLIEPDSGFGIRGYRDFPLTFSWQIATDPDPEDWVNYTLEISNNSLFIDPLTFHTEDQNSIALGYLDISIYWWRVKAEDRFGLETYSNTWTINVWLPVEEQNSSNIPAEYSIAETYPNPFNPTLNILVGLPEESELEVSIFNINGQEVTVLANGNYSAGYQHFTFDATVISSGIYFVHANVPGKLNEVRKVVLLE